MLSEFGIAIRKIRLDRQMLLKTMADDLGVTPAALSAVETGSRKVPKKWLDTIIELYDLSEEERDELIQASERSLKEICIPVSNISDQQKELAFSFAKALDKLTEEDIEHIMKALNSPKRGVMKDAKKRKR